MSRLYAHEALRVAVTRRLLDCVVCPGRVAPRCPARVTASVIPFG